jgi:predicted membrane-bound spermidine synthase
MRSAGLLAFAASGATLVLELVAGRLLAPYLGVSLQTWTAVIGVALAGISLGSWLGARWADRERPDRALGLLFMCGGLLAAGMLWLVGWLGEALGSVALVPRILLLTTAALLPPSLVLGMASPLTVRLAVTDVGTAGRSVGLVYALGTVGSLAGTFLTGFILVAHLPVGTIVLLVAAVLLSIGALVLGASARLSVDSGRPGRPRSVASPLEAPGLDRRVAAASAVAAAASFCTMAIELAASRILAPHVGVSLYSWTGIIGVVLAAMALGNYLGGRLADRCPGTGALSRSLFAGGLAALAILAATPAAVGFPPLATLGLVERVVVLSAAIFLAPILVLGTITPQAVRWALADLGRAGRVAGRIYAWSTAGAILGTFATGLLLIRLVGVYPLVLAAGLGLVAVALVVGRVWRRPTELAGALGATALLVGGLYSRGALDSICTRETDYFCIRVVDEWPEPDGQPIRKLLLDRLVHSSVKIGDPRYLGYAHEQVQAGVTRLIADRRPGPRVLVIGGGGYTYPRWVDAFVPGARVEVVEIDPGVTEVAHAELGLPRDTPIVSHHMDGRQFVRERAGPGEYEIVVLDAVNDLSVPYHLLTRELDDAVRRLLAPDGVYMVSVIDRYQDGRLLPAVLRTVGAAFPTVQLLSPIPRWSSGGAGVFVVVGSERGVAVDEIHRLLGGTGMVYELEPAALRAYVAAGDQVVLTDAYAPVDNLIAGLVRERG